MDITVTLRNKRNPDSVSTVPAELWDKKKNLPHWKNVYDVVQTVKEPPEVTALKAEPAKVEEVKVEAKAPVETQAIEPPAAPQPPNPRAKRTSTPRKKAEKK